MHLLPAPSFSLATRSPGWDSDPLNTNLLCIHCTPDLDSFSHLSVGPALPPPKVSTQISSYQWGLLSFSPHSSIVLTSIWYSIYSLVHLFSLFIHSPWLEHKPTGASALPCSLLDLQSLKINTDWVTEQMNEHVFWLSFLGLIGTDTQYQVKVICLKRKESSRNPRIAMMIGSLVGLGWLSWRQELEKVTRTSVKGLRRS